ncbi:MAG: metalloregulator ArsR/SmtB family transcription factor [Anaerolineae bacterium]|jgi:DNA-binding transcriptional ArsR family regulator
MVTQLLWDWGTAYDLFVSLAVLHDPATFGVRGSWAAGVRARLPETARDTLEQSLCLGYVPFHWIYSLPDPKDTTAVLWALGRIPPAERLPRLMIGPEGLPGRIESILRQVAGRGRWDEADREALQTAYHAAAEGHKGKKGPSAQKLACILDGWADLEGFGERYLEALRAYQEVFFAEEERRIRPVLREAVARAQESAGKLPFPELLEELSQGLRIDEAVDADELVLAPSYWSTPLVIFGRLTARREIWLFGARPADASLVPGETVPDALLQALKALSDPTRLRILHYLTQEPVSPADLSRRLRLRLPTVTHHLKTLRLAGLVRLSLGEGKETRRYAARAEAVTTAFHTLERFLKEGQETLPESVEPVEDNTESL